MFMRLCGRCGREMITEGIGIGDYRCIYGEDLANPTKILIHRVKEKGILFSTLKTKFLGCSVAICPECGHVEHYLNEKQLEEFKEYYAMRAQ